MLHFRFSGIAIAFCLGLLFFNLPFSSGQDISVAPTVESAEKSDSIDPLKIVVNVKEVMLGVVVLDKKGRQITDLTADDFDRFRLNNAKILTGNIIHHNMQQGNMIFISQTGYGSSVMDIFLSDKHQIY